MKKAERLVYIGIIVTLIVIFAIGNFKSSRVDTSDINIEQGDASTWFEDTDVVGSMTVAQVQERFSNDVHFADSAITFLQQADPAEPLKNVNKLKNIWKYTDHSFGYIPKGNTGQNQIPIQNAHEIAPDLSLKNKKLKITLDRLIVRDYPGKGEHKVLFDFYAQNQIESQLVPEHVHFNQVYRVKEGGQAGISGYTVFIGLNVGNEGISFKCYTVNVENTGDQKLVSFLESDLFTSGLRLLNSVNPVTPVLSNFAKGFTTELAKRNKNLPVQDINLGLDFTDSSPTRAKLAEGSFIAIQVPKAEEWKWSDWMYDKSRGQIVSTTDPNKGPEFNYIVFSITKMTE